eukprot:109174_1
MRGVRFVSTKTRLTYSIEDVSRLTTIIANKSPYNSLKNYFSEELKENISTEPWKKLTIPDAYKLQNEISLNLERDYNFNRKGYKIGGTSEKIQQMWGMKEPFCSPFYSLYNNNCKIEKNICVGIETEFLFKLNENINFCNFKSNDKDFTIDDVYCLIDKMYVGFEIVEPRINGFEIENDIKDRFNIPISYLIADLGWSGGFVIDENSEIKFNTNNECRLFDENVIRNCKVEVYVNDNFKID